MNQTSTAKVHEKVIFAFSGQGAAGPLPLNFLMRELPVFCQYTCRADDFLKERSYGGLIQLLCSGKISSTLEGQLFSFVFATAMSQQFLSMGINPDAAVGHSVGEAAACVLSGLFDYEDTLRYLCERSQIMEKYVSQGVMLFAEVTEAEALLIIEGCPSLAIAAVNGPQTTVISGALNEILRVEKTLDKKGTKHKRLRVPGAAHSPLLDPAMAQINKITPPKILKDAEIPVYSSLSGEEISDAQIAEPRWWGRHCRDTVRFMEALGNIKKRYPQNKLTFVEFGVHRVLASGGLETLKGSKWLGACSMPCYIPNKSPEDCFAYGIEETLSTLRGSINRFSQSTP